jgi:hypothetical protein
MINIIIFAKMAGKKNIFCDKYIIFMHYLLRHSNGSDNIEGNVGNEELA